VQSLFARTEIVATAETSNWYQRNYIRYSAEGFNTLIGNDSCRHGAKIHHIGFREVQFPNHLHP
jgi:hypothetical protein